MLDLGVELATGGRARPVLYVEREAYAVATLAARMEEGALAEAPVWSDLETVAESAEVLDYLWPRTGGRGIWGLVAGIPCQPHSLAGKRRGADDVRDLWPATARIIAKIGPQCVFLENVAGAARYFCERVIPWLEGHDYRSAAGLFAACEVGAAHQRKRLFVLADAGQQGLQGREWGGAPEKRNGAQTFGSIAEFRLPLLAPGPSDIGEWRRCLAQDPDLEPSIRRMADGMAARVDRLRLTGNGVVPLQAAFAFTVLGAALCD